MSNRIRQYPRVKQRVDRSFAASPANSLLSILSAVRELYNSSENGHSANNIQDLGYNQLVAFLHNDLGMSEEHIQQQLQDANDLPGSRQLNGLSDFIKWGTSRVWEWAGTSDERIASALQVFKHVEESLCLEDTEWQKTIEEDPYMGELVAKRFNTLLSLLKDCFAALVKSVELV
jgi:hypothetical protein